MKTTRSLLGLCTLPLVLILVASGLKAADTAPASGNPVRVLLLIGGHAFKTNEFYRMFKDNPQITFEVAAHPAAHALLKPEAARQYDVLVLYDMWQKISDEAKADFVARLKEGKGLVALHHCMASYQDWPEYLRMIGGKYHMKKRVVEGVEQPGSTYKHDVRFKVRVAELNHPVTRGLQDFEVFDETYGGFEVLPQARVLLTTDHPTSTPAIGWALDYEAARVVCLQPGHGPQIYDDPSYRRLVAQAIRWVARRD